MTSQIGMALIPQICFLSDYSTRNVEDSGSRRETAHGRSNGGPVSGVSSVGSGIEVCASDIVQTGREESVSSTQDQW